jgi:hypothetical protein
MLIGWVVAAVAIRSSIKEQAAVAMTGPIAICAIPILDAAVAEELVPIASAKAVKNRADVAAKCCRVISHSSMNSREVCIGIFCETSLQGNPGLSHRQQFLGVSANVNSNTWSDVYVSGHSTRVLTRGLSTKNSGS